MTDPHLERFEHRVSSAEKITPKVPRVFKTPEYKLRALAALEPAHRLARAVEMICGEWWTEDDHARWQALTGSTAVSPKVLRELADKVKKSAVYVDLEAEPQGE